MKNRWTLAIFAVVSACTGTGVASRIQGSVTLEDGLTLIRRIESFSSAQTAVRAACGSGELAIGGGCSCSGASSYITSTQRSGEGWSCSCSEVPDAGTHFSVVLCTSSTNLSRSVTSALIISLVDTAIEDSCSSGEAMAVSVHCGAALDGVLNTALPFAVQGGRARCATRPGGSGSLNVICIAGLPTVTRSQQVFNVDAGTTVSNTLGCSAGLHFSGGGCLCPSGTYLKDAYFGSDLSTQYCACANPTASAASGYTYTRCI